MIYPINSPEPNLVLGLGEKPAATFFHLRVRKTIMSQLKFWLFCQFFPFYIESWKEAKP